MESNVQCGECGALLNESARESDRRSCKNCGSQRRCINISIVDNINFKEMSEIKAKDATHQGKHAIRIEQLVGDDLHRNSGKWFRKVRIIDRANNRYFEEVTNPETGEIVHQCEEPLSDHIGHGSRRKRW